MRHAPLEFVPRKNRHRTLNFATPLACLRRWLPTAGLSLILTACASPALKESPTSAPTLLQAPSAPVSKPLSIPSVSLPSVARPAPTLPGQTKSEDEQVAAAAMETVQVNESKLVGYQYYVAMGGGVKPDTLWIQRPTTRFPSTSLWIEAGYNDYQIVAIEGKDLADLSIDQALHLIKSLPEPMHLTLRSRSGGRIVQLEAFYSRDGRSRGKEAPSHPMVEPRK